MTLFDSSALCFLQGEPGGDLVEEALDQPEPVCSAINCSEMAQKVLQHGRDWGPPQGLLRSYGLRVEPVLVADAWGTADGVRQIR